VLPKAAPPYLTGIAATAVRSEHRRVADDRKWVTTSIDTTDKSDPVSWAPVQRHDLRGVPGPSRHTDGAV